MLALQVIIWTCVLLFILTAIIAILALLGRITLGGGDGSKHDYYLRKLFTVLLLEVATSAVGAFAYSMSQAQKIQPSDARATSASTGTPVTNTSAPSAEISTTAKTSIPVEPSAATSAPERRSVPQPIANYQVVDAINLPYAQWTMINYSKRITDVGMNVKTTPEWTLAAPKDGLYDISASVVTDVPSNIRIEIRASTVVIDDSPVISDPAKAVKRVVLSGQYSLREGEKVWVQAIHSMHETNVVGGEISVKLLR